MLDVHLEGFLCESYLIESDCFNPFYTGCTFRSRCPGLSLLAIYCVSILLMLDVHFEVIIVTKSLHDYSRFNPYYAGCTFRRHCDQLPPDNTPGFNPSYAGCTFGSRLFCHRYKFVLCVSILLMLDVHLEVNYCNAFTWRAGSFNPSYAGCTFGRA